MNKVLVLGLVFATLFFPTAAALGGPLASGNVEPVLTVLATLLVVALFGFGLWVRHNYRIQTPERMGIGIRVSLWKKARLSMHKHGLRNTLVMVAAGLCGLPVVPGSYLKVPANSVWAGGTPRPWCTATFKVKTVTSLRSGVYVIKDTTDDEIKVAGAEAANAVAILTENNYTQPELDTAATAPTAGDEVECILLGLGAMAKVRNSANLAMGATVATSATGRAAAIGTATFSGSVGRTFMDHDGSTTEGDILVSAGGA